MLKKGQGLLLRAIPYLFFFLSGISGLAFETVWIRQLKLILGNTVYAVSIVFSVYMAGLAIGSVLGGKIADSRKDHIRVYAILELLIGASGVFLTVLLSRSSGFYVWIHRVLGFSPMLLAAVRYVYSIILLMVPTILMGATLPVLVKSLSPAASDSGRKAGMLYALNTFGAAFGCWCAGFLLIRAWGGFNTAAGAGLLCCSVGTAALILKNRIRNAIPDSGFPEESGKTVPATAGWALPVYILVCITGFCSLGFEVIWTRLLVMFIGNTVYAFSAMLTVYLTGLACGSLVCSFLLRKGFDPRILLSAAAGGASLYTLSTLYVLHVAGKTFAPYLLFFPVWDGAFSMLIRSAFLMWLPAFMFGMIFPSGVRITAGERKNIGRDTARIYFYNTAGAIIGSAVTGFVLIPLAGTERSFLLLSLFLLTAVYLVSITAFFRFSAKTRYSLGGTGVVLLVVLVALQPTDIFRRMHASIFPDREIIFYKEDPGGTVLVREWAGERELLIDNICVAGTTFEYLSSHKSLAHIPMLFHPDPEQVFILGFGAGGTSYSISRHPEVKHIDAAELIPSVGEAASLFRDMNGDIINKPEYSITYTDGRHFLLTTDKNYDVISIDLFCPQAAGAGNLFTREYYALCAEHLEEDGVFVQWLHPGFITTRHLRMILRTVQDSFAYTSLWFTYRQGHMVLMCSMKKPEIDFRSLAARMKHPEVRDDLAEIHMNEPAAFLRYFIAGGDVLAEFARSPGPKFITDDHPLIEFDLPFINYSSYLDNLNASLGMMERVESIVVNIPEENRPGISAFRRSTELLLKGLKCDFQGDGSLALKYAAEAVSVNPSDADAQYWRDEFRKKYESGNMPEFPPLP